MMAHELQTARMSAAAAAVQRPSASLSHRTSSSSSHGRRLRHENSLATAPDTSASRSQLRRTCPLINCSFNQLQMKACIIGHVRLFTYSGVTMTWLLRLVTGAPLVVGAPDSSILF